MIRDSSRKSDRVPRSSLQHRIRSPADAERPGNLAGADFVSLRAASTFSYALHPNVGVWLPSYIERLALAPLESVAETMRARVGVRSSLRRSFKDKLGWKPARILSRKDWHCVQDRAVVSWPRPGTEIRLDPAPNVGGSPTPEITPPRPHWLADDAVSIGLVSTANSLLTGKLTGNFVDSGPLPRFRRPVGKRIQWLAEQFPTQRNRQFLEALQGIILEEQGFF